MDSAVGTHRVIDQRSPAALPWNGKYVYIGIDRGSVRPAIVIRVQYSWVRTYPALNPWLCVVLARFRWADAKPAICAIQTITRIGRDREIFCDNACGAQRRQQLWNNS